MRTTRAVSGAIAASLFLALCSRAGLAAVVSIAAGYEHTLVADQNGPVWAFGRNVHGELGDGTGFNRSAPVQVLGLTEVNAVAGGNHSLALKGQSVWAWGYNHYGQVGDGTTTDKYMPVQVPGFTGVTAIDGGADHTAALKSNGTVWAWGSNIEYQLGDGTGDVSYSPVIASGLTGATAVAAGYAHSAALRYDGTVWTWGDNLFGQLGDGTNIDRHTPVMVPGLTGVIGIAAGALHTLALKGDGTLWAWGANEDGRLGDGTTTDRSMPVQVTGLSGVVAVAAGHTHTVALKNDGTVWTWGHNLNGQLGDGTTTDSHTPVQVPGFYGVTAIAAGSSHTLALRNDGTIWTWGWNLFGQLGDGTGDDSSLPVLVKFENNPPTGTVLIDGGAPYTTSLTPGLTLSATDDREIAGMRISNDGVFDIEPWEPYTTARGWSIPGGDGVKTIYAQFRDSSWNESAVVTDTIIYDSTGPSGSVLVNGGDLYTSSSSVSLAVAAADALSGVAQMRLSNDPSSWWSSWEGYATSKTWTLAGGGDGIKTVYVQFRDAAGNVSVVSSDTINLDTAGPSGGIAINGGAAYTASLNVTLTLSASDIVSDVDQMQFCNAIWGTWTDWEPYATTRSWVLYPGNGDRTVQVRFRDVPGNVSPIYSADIILDNTLPQGTIAINGGDAYAILPHVTLTLSASDSVTAIEAMRFSNDGTSWTDWEPYATAKAWTLSPGDGIKTVYVRFHDSAGNEGQFSDSIILDTTLPGGSVLINNGDAYTTSIAVSLALSASAGTVEMRVSNDGVFDTEPWEPYAAAKSWNLPSGDGPKTVYARFRTAAGTESPTVTDTIILDSAGPEGSVVINSGDTYTGSVWVTLTLFANDALAGVNGMRFSNDGTHWSEWETYATSKVWGLAEGDGLKTVFVSFRDILGNETQVSDTVTLHTGPTGTIVINGGDAYTGSATVTLTLSADGPMGVADMAFSNDSTTWSEWESFTTTRTWTLSTGDGEKYVCVKYRDSAGKESPVVWDYIDLDTTPPEGEIFINGGFPSTTSPSVDLLLIAFDLGSQVRDMRISNDGVFDTEPWEDYAWSRAWTLSGGDGLKTVFVKLRDYVGNESEVISATILLDTSSVPSGTVTINGGSAYAPSTSVVLMLDADGPQGVVEMRFSNDNTTWTEWESYTTSKNWDLVAGDGLKWVYAQFRDVFGGISPSASDTIAVGTHVTLAQAKASPAHAVAIVTHAVVTAVFDDRIYVEDTRRGVGLRLSPAPDGVLPGTPMDISGTLDVVDGEKTLLLHSWSATGVPMALLPVGMTNRDLGGGDWLHDPATGAGQKGVAGGSGLNTIGLLVRTWGRVVDVEPVAPPARPSWFRIDDGSRVGLKVAIPAGVDAPHLHSFVHVTGISSCEEAGPGLARLLRVREQPDIAPAE